MAVKKIFEPDVADELLRGWLLHAHKSRDRHDFSARKYDKWRYFIGIPATIITAAVGTAVFATLLNSSGDGSQSTNSFFSGNTITFLAGSLAILAAILTSLQSFLDLGSFAERHRLAGVRYKALIREMEQMGIGTRSDLKLQDDIITDIRKRFDALGEESPVIPPRIYQTIESKYSEKRFVDSVLEPTRLLENNN